MTRTNAPGEPVSVALELHHHRLDDMLDRIEIDIELGSWGEARRGFSLLRRELEEHLRLEEQMVLPELGAAADDDGWQVTSMRDEHARIRECLELLDIDLEDEYPLGKTTEALSSLLAVHNAREERFLYPMFERMASSGAYAAASFELMPLLRSSV